MGKQLPSFAATNPPKPGEERHSLTLPDTKKYAYFVIYDKEEDISVFCVRVKKCSFGLASKFTNEVMNKFLEQFPTLDDRIGCEKEETQKAFVGELKATMQTYNSRYIK